MGSSSPPTIQERAAVLERARNKKMARSAHGFVRGHTVQFYEWLASLEGERLPHGPPVWICGDCHLGNPGPVADTEGLVRVQIRDLDHTVIGNPAHDLVRLGLSLSSEARGSGLPGDTTVRMLEALMDGYESAFDHELDEADHYLALDWCVPGPGAAMAVRSASGSTARSPRSCASPTSP